MCQRTQSQARESVRNHDGDAGDIHDSKTTLIDSSQLPTNPISFKVFAVRFSALMVHGRFAT